jgi:hypothetical protein
MTARGKKGFWRDWRRWLAAMHFVDALYTARRTDVSADDR